jgi:hypothetical protein
MVNVNMTNVSAETQARIKKENVAGKNIIPLLIKLLDDKHITIPVTSEKTSITQMNRLKMVIDVLKDVFNNYSFNHYGLDGKCCRGCFADLTNAEYCELRLGYGGGICSEIFDKLKLGKKKVHYYSNSISSAKSFYSSDKDAYSEVTFNEEEYTMCWKPEVRTQTEKRKIEDVHDDLITQLIHKLDIHPATGYYALPYGCQRVGNRNRITIGDIKKMNNTILSYINDNSPLPLCSEKQAYWCSKFLGCRVEEAKQFNKYQASDILNVYFEKTPTTQEEWNDVKEFYLSKLK